MLRPPLCQSLVAATSAPVEITLEQIFEEYGWDTADVLTALALLRTTLDAWDLEGDPDLGSFGLDTPRVVRRKAGSDPTQLAVLEISRGEGPTVEFKETLLLDIKKHEFGGKPISQCASEVVLLSALKTIAAFLNTNGGTLLVGVADNKDMCSVEREFELTCPSGKLSFDHWELYLRRKIESLFVDGRSILPSIIVQPVTHGGGTIARIVVGSRRKLSFMHLDGVDTLFIRSGNETLKVRLSEIEQYFDVTKLYI